MGATDISLGRDRSLMGSTVQESPLRGLGGDTKAQAGRDSQAPEASLLSRVLIEETIQDEEARDHAAKWQTWVPDLEHQFKDRMLSLVAERFKISSMAQGLSERGAQSLEEALKMISELEPEARKRYPRYSWIDAIYKYLGDTRHG